MIDIITYWLAVTLLCAPAIILTLILCGWVFSSEVSRITRKRLNPLGWLRKEIYETYKECPELVMIPSAILIFTVGMQMVIRFGDRVLRELPITEVIHQWALWLQPFALWVLILSLYIVGSSYLKRFCTFLYGMKDKLDKVK